MVIETILTILGMSATWWLIHTKSFSPVRASSLVTLVFTLALTYYDKSSSVLYSGALFGGSFLGMTEPARLKGKKLVLAAGVFSLVFHFLIPYSSGFGGGVGLAVFVSCVFIYFTDKVRGK